MLVNNAGVAHYMPFTDLPASKASELLHVKVVAPTMLARAAAPGMVARGGGTIVNVAGMLAFGGPAPLGKASGRAVYVATLAHLVAFTQALHEELQGLRIQVLCPGIVATEFHTRQGMDLSALPRMSSEDVVTASLRGLELGEVVCAPAWKMQGFSTPFSRRIWRPLAGSPLSWRRATGRREGIGRPKGARLWKSSFFSPSPGADPLSDVLALLKPRGYMAGGIDAGGDWSLWFGAFDCIRCFAVSSGQCWLAVDGVAEPALLLEGDCVLLPLGIPFRLASDLALEPVDVMTIITGPLQGRIATYNGGGACLGISALFTFAATQASLLLGVLPPIVHLRRDSDKEALRWSLDRISPGAARTAAGWISRRPASGPSSAASGLAVVYDGRAWHRLVVRLDRSPDVRRHSGDAR